MFIVCPYCDHKWPSDALFKPHDGQATICPSCGEPFLIPVPQITPVVYQVKKNQDKINKAYGVGCICIIVLFVLCAGLGQLVSRPEPKPDQAEKKLEEKPIYRIPYKRKP